MFVIIYTRRCKIKPILNLANKPKHHRLTSPAQDLAPDREDKSLVHDSPPFLMFQSREEPKLLSRIKFWRIFRPRRACYKSAIREYPNRSCLSSCGESQSRNVYRSYSSKATMTV